MVHWDDVKANTKELAKDLYRQKIGVVGISLIALMVTIALLAPVLAPEANEEWSSMEDRWADKPERAPPVWYDYITTTDYAHHRVEEDYSVIREQQIGGSQYMWLEFTQEIDSDVPPQEIFMKIGGNAERIDEIKVKVIRPEADTEYEDLEVWTVLEKDDIQIQNNGDFDIWQSLRRYTEFKELAVDKGFSYINSEYDVPRTEKPRVADITNPVHVLFGKPSEDMLRDPETLRGEYTIEIRLKGEGISLDEERTKTTFSGAVYGLMGTDTGRRDLWQGWVWGARYGLIAGGVVAIFTIILSTLYGMTSAYYGGWVDEAMQRLNEIMMGIPTLPVLIILLLYWRSIWMFITVYALLMWRGAAKVVRSRGLQVAKDTYIEASEAIGAGSGRIISRHMIPQILPYSFAQASLLIPIVIMAEAGLHILGLGDRTIVTWGTILNNSRAEGALLNLGRSWWWVLLPGLGMIMVGFGFIATGMAIERIINPKMKQR
ncbi:MAG: ABC transporter permease [Candidatus Thermoplasmatota archaeon]